MSRIILIFNIELTPEITFYMSVTGVQAYSPKIHNTFPEIWIFYQLISGEKWNIIFIGEFI